MDWLTQAEAWRWVQIGFCIGLGFEAVEFILGFLYSLGKIMGALFTAHPESYARGEG